MKLKSIIYSIIIISAIIFPAAAEKNAQFKMPDNFILVEGGSFDMGDEIGDGQKGNGENDEGPVHKMNVGSFWIGKFEVTQKEWAEITGEVPSDGAGTGDNFPVYHISWYDCIEYCNRVSEKAGLKPYYNINKSKKDKYNVNKYDDIKWIVTVNEGSDGFRLPTEAEWEFAARGGLKSKKTKYSGSNIINEVAVYEGNSGNKTSPVGSKKPNELGIYDMSGNVWEWCWDTYDRYPGNTDKAKFYSKIENSKKNYMNYRALRGGAYNYEDVNCRVSNRTGHGANLRTDHYGIRLARSQRN
jgi:formylglycine-generating enzyme